MYLERPTVVVFSPFIVTYTTGSSESPIEIAPNVFANGAVIDPQAVKSLEVKVFSSSTQLPLLRDLALSLFTSLRELKLVIVFDTLNEARIVQVWAGFLALVKSIPAPTQLDTVKITSPVPLSVIHSAWSQSTLVGALERPLYSVDRALVGLVDHSPLSAVKIVPPEGEEFNSNDEVHVRNFFRALYDFDMLKF